MLYWTTIISACLDGASLYVFHQVILGKKNAHFQFYWTLLFYALAEIGCNILVYSLYGNTSLYATLIRISLSISITFSLSFFFKGNINVRIFSTLSFITIACLSENLVAKFIQNILLIDISNPSISEISFSGISLITDAILFVLSMILRLFVKEETIIHSKTYTMILLIVPLLSICVLLSKPLLIINISMPKTYFMLDSFLLFINIVNYILLQNVLQSEELQTQLEIQSEQLEYQKNKYQQLGEAYKNIRSFMHDTKKHLFYIENCVNEKKYDEIIPYSREIMQNLESRYCTINTGNLVIDAFVSNLLLQTKRLGITLHTNLNIDNRIIPVNDYHLTIILGNLLDNALNACKDQTNAYIKVTIQTVSDTFTIHITNTYAIADPDQTPKDFDNIDFIHGYGLKNVKKSVSAYNGICMVQCENDIYSVTAIIPLYPVNKN